MQAIHVDDDDDDSGVCNLSRGSKSMARKMQGRKMRNQIYRTGGRTQDQEMLTEKRRTGHFVLFRPEFATI